MARLECISCGENAKYIIYKPPDEHLLLKPVCGNCLSQLLKIFGEYQIASYTVEELHLLLDFINREYKRGSL